MILLLITRQCGACEIVRIQGGSDVAFEMETNLMRDDAEVGNCDKDVYGSMQS